MAVIRIDAVTASHSCATCGRPLDVHNRHVRFTFPDPLLAASEDQRRKALAVRAGRQSRSHDAGSRGGPFLRALLPIHLSGSYTLRFGLWLLVHPDDLQRAVRLCWSPEYADFKVDGWLANSIPPWGLLAAPVTAVVRDPNQTPDCDTSTEPMLTRVLAEDWPHEDVLAALLG
jgi:hypothetical protein